MQPTSQPSIHMYHVDVCMYETTDFVCHGMRIYSTTAHAADRQRIHPSQTHTHTQQQQQQQQGGSSSVPPVVYVIYADVKGSWRVHAVAEEEGSFTSRKALPEQWRGLRDEELSRVMGIEGGVFVHGTGFIGGHATKEGAMKMAEKALAA
mmetsp:Transcript_44186/g.125018  ORF Transcript_44186/g.125018 Transcript_44186/m.125018 type:complete len:150 (+) Transcript_44186:137-586(+)